MWMRGRRFAELVAERLRALLGLGATANEARPVAPGVYGPRCPKHETLSSGPNTFDVRVDVNAIPVSFPELIRSWRAGGQGVAATADGAASVCP